MSGTIGEGPTGEKRREVPYLGVVKIASVVMGIMIVVGLAVIGVTIAKRLSGAGDTSAEQPTAATAVGAPQAVGDHDIALPRGARLIGTALDGNRLALRLELADGRAAILLVDAGTGARLGLLTLTPAAD